MVCPTCVAGGRQDSCHSAGRGVALNVPFLPSCPLAGENCRILRCFGFQQREAFWKSLETELLLCTLKNSAILISLRRYQLRCGRCLQSTLVLREASGQVAMWLSSLTRWPGRPVLSPAWAEVLTCVLCRAEWCALGSLSSV